jgi:hypothetical protein
MASPESARAMLGVVDFVLSVKLVLNRPGACTHALSPTAGLQI